MNFSTLRKDYPEFLYRGYRVSAEEAALCIEYDFSISGLCDFHPRWRIPCTEPQGFLGDPAVERMVFSLGMTELVSYWKITCSPVVRILCGSLTEAQCGWWKKLYFGGLGEFFYRNGIETDPEGFMTIRCEGKPLTETPSDRSLKGRLIPVGGGKDSIVTLHLLRHLHADSMAYMINHRDSSVAAAKLAGIPEERICEVYRSLDPNMLECNAKGFLNGHTPFSAIVAFSAVLTAYLHGVGEVILSNESSACESTVSQAEINHQYSKSYAFEHDFFTYEQEFLRSGVQYYSLLRPLTEFQIARYFAALPSAYHEIFRSCNAGAKKDAWCGKCAKCLFVSVILLPFLPYEWIVSLIGNDMLGDEAYGPVLQELCGLLPNKPFECVGSRKEVNIALCLGIAKAEQAGMPLPSLLRGYRQTALYEEYAPIAASFGGEFDIEHHLPKDMEVLVQQACVTAFQTKTQS
ncbi:MAG: hypothetical protein IJC75_06335 [Oscillospiraceae bacterium]|nr:hypothetical protein [Oscillospiraceae bacterium]